VVPRADVAGARRWPGLGMRGRVELSFHDGSVLVLSTGVFSGRDAEQFVAVLGEPPFPVPSRRDRGPSHWLVKTLVLVTTVTVAGLLMLTAL
jgi:hypothetical protein